MKSVVLVAFSGSWFCSSLTSRLRKSVELSVEDTLDATEDEVDVEVADETVMTNLSSSRCAAERVGGSWS
jgi:hypothetical protein